MPPSEPRVRVWLTPQEVGIMVGFSASFIRNEIHAHELPAQAVPSRVSRWMEGDISTKSASTA